MYPISGMKAMISLFARSSFVSFVIVPSSFGSHVSLLPALQVRHLLIPLPSQPRCRSSGRMFFC